MNFLHQSFRKLSSDRQRELIEIINHAALRVVSNNNNDNDSYFIIIILKYCDSTISQEAMHNCTDLIN